jgi:hypothetical protein
VIALKGPVRSSPRITKVEKTYIIPAAAALAIAATDVRMTIGLVFILRVNGPTSRRSIADCPDRIRIRLGSA